MMGLLDDWVCGREIFVERWLRLREVDGKGVVQHAILCLNEGQVPGISLRRTKECYARCSAVMLWNKSCFG